MPTPLRLVLGFIIFISGALFIFFGVFILKDFQIGQNDIFSLLLLLLIFIGLGSIFGYVGIRLMRSDSLLQKKEKYDEVS